MKMDLNISPANLKAGVITFLHRFHVMIFVIVVLGGLIIVTLMLNNIIVRSGESDGYTPTSSDTSFDQATIDRIKQLRTSDQNTQLQFPGGRSNPFVE